MAKLTLKKFCTVKEFTAIFYLFPFFSLSAQFHINSGNKIIVKNISYTLTDFHSHYICLVFEGLKRSICFGHLSDDTRHQHFGNGEHRFLVQLPQQLFQHFEDAQPHDSGTWSFGDFGVDGRLQLANDPVFMDIIIILMICILVFGQRAYDFEEDCHVFTDLKEH